MRHFTRPTIDSFSGYELQPWVTELYETSSAASFGGERYVNTSTWTINPLRSHGGTGANLLLRWNNVPADAREIDVVVHLHGYINGSNEQMLRTVAGYSGLDLTGRMRPTLAILPRGRLITPQEVRQKQAQFDEAARRSGTKPAKARSDEQKFPGLLAGDGAGLESLITEALKWFTQQRGGPSLSLGYLILTAHSGGGSPLDRLLTFHPRRRVCNPDEVHAFDALYSEARGIKSWITARLANNSIFNLFGPLLGALRVFYRPNTATQSWSQLLGRSLPPSSDTLSSFYRIDCSRLSHFDIPKQFGPRLLRDRTAGLSSLESCTTGVRSEIGGYEMEFESSAACKAGGVPPSLRPKLLIRGSVHPAVSDAQRKLNAFHASRIAAGQPGLRDAPLVVDCIFGKKTFEAVKSFQELVFPGVTDEHDGKIGPKTWVQLDAITVAPGPGSSAQITVEQLRITDDSFTSTLTWDHVIGLDTASLNAEFVGWGLPAAAMPSQIEVEITSRSPNGAGGTATLGTRMKLAAARFSADAGDPNRIIYRLSRPLATLSDFLKVEGAIKEVATIVRRGGTSDVTFRRALGWTSRGIATQPGAAGVSTGSESGEIPDAFALFRAAGVETLELSVPAQTNWSVPGSVKRLVRNPADAMYYSGHGLSRSGKLAVDIENRNCPEHGTYQNWLGPSDLIPVWIRPMDLDVLILAGCSVLRITFSTSPASGPGIGWSKLLRTKGGTLTALLGYRGSAPCDSPNGERIANLMAQRMKSGSTSFANDWLTINGENNANNAVAMDGQGYWWIEGGMLGGYEIKGPATIP